MSRKIHNAYMDEQIIRLNAVALSLSSIATLLGCHPSTVTNRLKSLGIPPLDSRRAFMEDILMSLTEDQQEWIVQHMEDNQTDIKQYIKQLIEEKYSASENSGN